MWRIESYTSLGWRCTTACMARHRIICLSCAHRSLSCRTTASSFCQPPSTRSTLSARYVRPSHLRCRWTNDMKLVPKQFVWAGYANWLFLSYTEDVSFLSVLGALSALEALFVTMRYINSHLHYTVTMRKLVFHKSELITIDTWRARKRTRYRSIAFETSSPLMCCRKTFSWSSLRNDTPSYTNWT